MAASKLTSSLNLNSQFDRNYKKVSSRLKTIHRIRHLLTDKLAKDVFRLMVLPTLSYCSLLKPSFSNTQVKKLRSLERQSKSLINNFDLNTINLLKKRVCFFAHGVINEKVRPPLNDFYEVKFSKINMRINDSMVKLPKEKLECGRLSLKFTAAKIFNDLPLEFRKQCFHKSFKSSLKICLASN